MEFRELKLDKFEKKCQKCQNFGEIQNLGNSKLWKNFEKNVKFFVFSVNFCQLSVEKSGTDHQLVHPRRERTREIDSYQSAD